MEKDKWVVWYEDDMLDPIAVAACDRSTAGTIGDKARPDAIPTAVVREDEGATITVADEKVSTIDNPKRFITEVLSEKPNRSMSTQQARSMSKESEEEIISDTTASDILSGDDLR